MLGCTHVLIGVAGLVAYSASTGFQPDALAYTAAAVGSLLPDIDHPKSMIGSFFPWMPRIGPLGHRRFTHTIWFVGMLAYALHYYVGPEPWVVAGLWGVVSHLAADVLTEKGTPLLWPMQERAFCIPLVTTGGLLENALAAALAFGCVWVWVGVAAGECALPAAFCP